MLRASSVSVIDNGAKHNSSWRIGVCKPSCLSSSYISLIATNQAIGSGSGQWSAAYTKAKALVAQMTLIEKVRFRVVINDRSI
jgi:hypothetical protein